MITYIFLDDKSRAKFDALVLSLMLRGKTFLQASKIAEFSFRKKPGLKTKLPKSIESVREAKEFLTELHKNGELFHPDDNPMEIRWNNSNPSIVEKNQLRILMGQIDAFYGDFDVYQYCAELTR